MIKKLIATFTALSIMITPIQSFAIDVSREQVQNIIWNTAIIRSGENGGTGFIYGEYIITAAHIIDQTKQLHTVIMSNNEGTLSRVLSIDEEKDICILSFRPNTVGLKFSKDSLWRMDEVYYCGHPYGSYYTVGKGYVSNVDVISKQVDGLVNQFSIWCIGKGSSGAPILNSKNELVGMVSGELNGGSFTFAIRNEDIIAEINEYEQIKKLSNHRDMLFVKM